jgi:hypothetical protein
MVLGLRIDKLYSYLLAWASTYNWSASRYWPVALCYIRTWGITKDGQGYHHLPLAPQPRDTRQMKVAFSLDTMSTLSTTTLVRI